jgi:hypothetical protein
MPSRLGLNRTMEIHAAAKMNDAPHVQRELGTGRWTRPCADEHIATRPETPHEQQNKLDV